MAITEPPFSIGIEEEYLLVDQTTFDLAVAPEQLMEDCKAELQGQVSPEFLQCQIEIGTRVCKNVSEARDDLRRLRSCISRVANNYGLSPIAASCHPFADWKQQQHTDKERYNVLAKDLGGVVRRMLICGMHVHVGLGDDDMRIDVMNQFSYFLPHLLALSTSSPFWQGDDTGLASYRLTIFDNLPRTGLPPSFPSFADYERAVDALVDLNVIEDSSKIWWDLRPSAHYPTLETRTCDVNPRLEDTLTIAALIQSISRMLFRLREKNQRWRQYDNFLISENRWRAQRYGTAEGLIDFGRREIVPFDELMQEIAEMTAEDAEALGCTAEIARIPEMLARGTSSDRQRTVLANSMENGKSKPEAMQDVVRHLVEEFHQDL